MMLPFLSKKPIFFSIYVGRGKKAEPEPMEESSESEEEVVPKGRGRGSGRGKRSAEEAFGKVGAKAGRGGKKKK